MISVLILTKDEELCIAECLASVAWSSDVHVFDSHSADRTVEIAQRAGARVTQRIFDGYASQRNAALRTCAFRNEWVLVLDADERIPAGLRDELLDFVAGAPDDVVAARFRRRDIFMGTWLKHAQISPFYVRLVRPPRVRYEREINELLKVDGKIRDLRQHFDHFPFMKGIAQWVEKHNQYSSMEAKLALASGRGETRFSLRKAFLGRDFNERRIHQKELFYRMPFRPLVKWIYMVVFRLAILDGRAGLAYASLQCFYEYLIVLKSAELRRQRS